MSVHVSLRRVLVSGTEHIKVRLLCRAASYCMTGGAGETQVCCATFDWSCARRMSVHAVKGWHACIRALLLSHGLLSSRSFNGTGKF